MYLWQRSVHITIVGYPVFLSGHDLEGAGLDARSAWTDANSAPGHSRTIALVLEVLAFQLYAKSGSYCRSTKAVDAHSI